MTVITANNKQDGATRRRRTAKLDGPHPIDVHVGSRVRHRRAMLGLNQTELALKVGVTFQSIQKYERGSNRVSASRLQEIAEVLGVSVNHFFEGLVPAGAAPEACAAPAESLTSQEIRDLNATFALIKDKTVRQAVLQLLKRVAGIPAFDSAAVSLPSLNL